MIREMHHTVLVYAYVRMIKASARAVCCYICMQPPNSAALVIIICTNMHVKDNEAGGVGRNLECRDGTIPQFFGQRVQMLLLRSTVEACQVTTGC